MQSEAINKSEDVSAFLKILESLPNHHQSELRNLFEVNKQLTIARAPGRLDVMGGIADYSGSLVLQRPIAEATFAALQLQRETVIRVVSLYEKSNEATKACEMSLSELYKNGEPISYDSGRELFRNDAINYWVAYVIGIFLVLAHERQAKFENGASILISSRVPEGKGVSSSAALEVAV
ncbi:MAG TPA: hypothetical protein VEF04_02835, partial [Blastocatellia bacterium]|nr:hypothetical protein [Blastocatellia bacterium]